MAQSRLEKIGTIYSRAKGLLKSNAVNWADRPLWYDIYESFPPKEEPRFDRPIPNIPLKSIFYEEDKIRAIFHRNNKTVGTFNLVNNKSKTLTQRFIETYQKLDRIYDGSAMEEQIYKETIDMMKREREAKYGDNEEMGEEQISLSSAFRDAKESSSQIKHKPELNINVKDIFKE